MKIGIVSIGNNSMELFSFLQRYDHEYHVYYDAEARPLGEKTFEKGLEIVKKGVKFLQELDVDHIIVPPLFEAHLISDEALILPLYTRYLQDVVFPDSLVGKLGVLSDPGQRETGQNILAQQENDYSLTAVQQATKKFHSPMKYRAKDVRMRGLLLRSLSPKDFLVNKVVKFDLRYFKDANVDTIIPTDYLHFAIEKTIQRFFNQKKHKFHEMSAIEALFVAMIENKPSVYAITIHCKGRQEMLSEKKRYMWMLQRGKGVDVLFMVVK